jgi:putative peptidoglycan lipid II flippase
MKKGIIKTFTFMFSAIFLAKVLGLVRNIVFANFYGTGFEATAFFTASRIPLQLLDMTLGAAISSTFIPIFNEYLQKDGKKRAIQFANNFLNVIIVVSLLLTILGIIFAPQIVSIIAPDLESQTLELTVQLIKILFPIMIFTAVAYVSVGFLQSMDEFRIPSIISVVANGILILYLAIFNNKFGIKGVAIAMLVGWATQILVQIPSVIKKGFKYKFSIDFKDEGLKKILKLAPPILISTWVQPINNIVNIRLASGLQDGQAVSALEYSYNLYLIIVGVFSYTLSNIIFPELSKLTADNNKSMIVEILNKSIKISLFLIIPMSVGIGVLSNDIIKLIYERGEFTATSTYLTGGALTYYAIGMIGYGLMEILNKAFYAMQDSKTPMKISALAIIMNILLSIGLVKVNDYLGLPLAASITSIITAILMIYAINKKMNGIVDKKTTVECAKTIVSALIMGVVVYLIAKINIKHQIITLAVSALSGVIVYFITMLVLKSETIDEFKKIIKLKK